MMRSQNDAILSALRAGDEITPMMALQRWGCLRLAARIHDLRRRGHNIRQRIDERDGKRWAVYWMEAER